MSIERVELFQGDNGRWYFRRVARNNRKTAASQGYRRRWSAKRAARKTFPDLPIVLPE